MSHMLSFPPVILIVCHSYVVHLLFIDNSTLCLSLRPPSIRNRRLKLNSAQGSLYFRFISDLEEWTSRQHDHDDEIVKNDALHWCHTIIRLCGVEQLQQKLPNFGQEGSAELLDFIDFASRDNDDADTNKKIHRRIKSRVNLAQLGEVMKGHAHTPGTGHSRKPSSGIPAIPPPKRGSMNIPVGDQDKDLSLSIRRKRNSQVSFALDDEAEKDRGSDVELGLAVSEKSYTSSRYE